MLLGQRLVGMAAHDEREQPEHAADEEGDAPAEVGHLRVGEHRGEEESDGRADERAHRDGGGVDGHHEAAPAPPGALREEGADRAGLRAKRQALGDAHEHQPESREDADGRRCRSEADQGAGHGDDRDRHGEGSLATHAIGDPPERHASHRPGDEPDGEDGEGGDECSRRVTRGEELRREVEREDRVDRPVVPLDDVANRCRRGGAAHGPRRHT